MNTTGTALPRTAILASTLLLVASVMAQATAAAPAVAPTSATADLNSWLLGIAILQAVLILAFSSILSTLSGPGPHWSKFFNSTGTRTLVLLPLLLLVGGTAQAQAYPGPDHAISELSLFWLLVMLNALLLFVLLFQIKLIHRLTRLVVAPSTAQHEPVKAKVKRASWWARLGQSLTRQVPVEQEQDIVMDHEYDGIRELDNSLPPWWVWLFYGTIVWAVVYIVNVHVIKIWPNQDTEYRLEMAQAKSDVDAYLATLTDLVDENTVERHNDPSMIATGKTIYMDNCTPCHGKSMEGVEGLGPNLTDAYWKHGGGIKNIFKVIKYGVPDKGMISWKSQLKPSEIASLSEFILSLEGSNPPNAKAPEGELWKEEGSTTEPSNQTSEADTARTAAM